MSRRWVLIIVALNLVGLVALAFIYPHLMVSPGPLIAGHTALTTDCFACHVPLRGSSSDKCVSCHAQADIGLRNTKGQTLVHKPVKTAFHQALTGTDCMACHSDHAAPRLTKSGRKPFSHAMLGTAVQDKCETCHTPPAGAPASAQTIALHRDLQVTCSQCHSNLHWKPASFDHATLAKPVLERCESCHKKPADALHRQISANCGQCHSPAAWKPANFNHDKFFVLDKDHNASCETCHVKSDFSRFTCYGCHEHTQANIERKHTREGISNFDNCVECHRSAHGEREGGKGGGGREGSDRKRNDD